jgi:UDP-N-acetylmuramate dehydrogenase
MSFLSNLTHIRGLITENADVAKGSWFRVGGPAEFLFQPADEADLSHFLTACPETIPITILGLGSNIIIRDGGIKGVVIKLGKNFNRLEQDTLTNTVEIGAGAGDVAVARHAAKQGLGGFEFLSGIPGSIGGALRMNAGAYGSDIGDILIDARVMDRDGQMKIVTKEEMQLSYRHNSLPYDTIFISARFQAYDDDSEKLLNTLDDIKKQREETQPVKDRTGGSTFANPSPKDLMTAGLPNDMKAWQLIDQVGGRGFKIGGAMMSEKHCNFMINDGHATAHDLESLGEEMRRRVRDKFGLTLQWEIQRIGQFKDDFDTCGEA